MSSATIQRGGKMTKSALARPGVSLGEVSTVKIDGSGWSKLTVPMVLNRASPGNGGARFRARRPHPADLWSSVVALAFPDISG